MSHVHRFAGNYALQVWRDKGIAKVLQQCLQCLRCLYFRLTTMRKQIFNTLARASRAHCISPSLLLMKFSVKSVSILASKVTLQRSTKLLGSEATWIVEWLGSSFGSFNADFLKSFASFVPAPIWKPMAWNGLAHSCLITASRSFGRAELGTYLSPLAAGKCYKHLQQLRNKNRQIECLLYISQYTIWYYLIIPAMLFWPKAMAPKSAAVAALGLAAAPLFVVPGISPKTMTMKVGRTLRVSVMPGNVRYGFQIHFTSFNAGTWRQGNMMKYPMSILLHFWTFLCTGRLLWQCNAAFDWRRCLFVVD